MFFVMSKRCYAQRFDITWRGSVGINLNAEKMLLISLFDDVEVTSLCA
jgi:hypothetical protein